MPTTLANIQAILLDDDVLGAIQSEFNESIPIFSEMESQSLVWSGRDAIFKLQVTRNGSFTGSSTNATPAAQQEEYIRLIVTAKKGYGTMQIDGDALASSEGQKNNGADEAERQINGLVRDSKNTLESWTFNGGVAIGYVWEKPAGAAPALLTFAYTGRHADIAVGLGETVSFYRMDNYAQLGIPTQINSINATTLVLNAAIDTKLANFPTLAGVPILVVVDGAQAALTINKIAGATSSSGIDAALSAEAVGIVGNLGLQSHFNSANRNTNVPVGSITLRSNFVCLTDSLVAGDVLTLADLQNAIGLVSQASNERPDAFWLSPMQITSYTTLLQGTSAGNLRTDVKQAAGKADPGYTDLAYANVPFKTSNKCPNRTIFGIYKESWRMCYLKKGAFIDFEGTGPLKRVANTDSATATWALYYNMVCKQPNRNVQLIGVSM